MKTFRHILLYLHAALILGIATACHDDLASPTPDHEPKIGTGIVLKIPNFNDVAEFSETRADYTAGLSADEGKINQGDIWLMIYNHDETPQTGDDYNFHIQLSNIEELTTEGEMYKVSNGSEDYYYIPMYPGKYKAYVVANIDQYTDKDLSEITESDLRSITLNFADHFSKTSSEGTLVAGELPMACMPENVANAPDGIFNILDKNLTSLDCTLQFLCSKVRYTVLFDNTDTSVGGSNGFSDQFGLGSDNYLLLEKAYISQVGNLTCLIPTDDAANEFEGGYTQKFMETASYELPLHQVKYPKKNDSQQGHYFHESPDHDYEEGSAAESAYEAFQKNPLANVDQEDHWEEEGQRSWQGTIYIPENIDANKRTKIDFKGHVGNAASGYTSEQNYSFELIKSNSDTDEGTTPLRGYFYDITLKAKGRAVTDVDINFTVTPWVKEPIKYELGQYYLYIIDPITPVVDLQPGSSYSFKYQTNADKLIGHSPEVEIDELDANGNKTGKKKKVPVYKFYNTDGFKVEFNSEITSEYFASINSNKDQYNFFHIQAGNIYKRIQVSPFELKQFLMVDPDEITIRVSEKIVSGEYSGSYPITVTSNYKYFKVSSSKWGADSNALYLSLDEAGTQKISFDTYYQMPSSGEKIIYLQFAGLNSGNSFWTQGNHELSLNVGVKDTNSGDATEEEKVDVFTYSSSDNYVIHFKANGWDRPHIYVYQCLELPADLTYTDKDGNKVASKTVGYGAKEWKNSGDHSKGTENNFWAALEYSFTGKVAFLGWEKPVNKNMLTEATLKKGSVNSGNQGFYLFEKEFYDQTGTEDSANSSWNVGGVKSQQRYNTNMDFCADQRSSSGCRKCKDPVEYNILWPGIMMQDEGNGWWKFVLTGVAKPGKALIMFNNGHADENNNKRYPLRNEVGIPLFNYPTREGWFDYDGTRAFTSTNPNNSVDPVETPNTVYFQNPDGWGTPKAYCWNSDSDKNCDKWENAPEMTLVSSLNGVTWYKYEADRNWAKVIFYSGTLQTGDLDFNPGHKYNQYGDQGAW